jgi:hypothetical protein
MARLHVFWTGSARQEARCHFPALQMKMFYTFLTTYIYSLRFINLIVIVLQI